MYVCIGRTSFVAMSDLEIVHAGTPPEDFEDHLHVERKTVLVAFHNFAVLRGQFNPVQSKTFHAFGPAWTVRLFPEGVRRTSVFLVRDDGDRNSSSHVFFEVGTWSPTPNVNGNVNGIIRQKLPRGSGWIEFENCERLENNCLVNGALVLKISMWTRSQITSREVSNSEFVPSNPFLSNMLKEYANEETSDVAFEVGGARESDSERRKQARTNSTTFHAHHLVLRCNAPALAEMCKPGTSSPVRIPNVSPEAFKHMLYYCYGGEIVEENLEENARELVDAADRFGVTNLKLKAEACLVRSATFTPDNILDNLLYADSKNCALFLEKAMDYVVENRDEVVEKVSFDDLW